MFSVAELIPLLALFIPIVAIVMSIGLALLAVYLNYRKRKEMFALYHQERLAAIEKGIDLPPLPEAFFSEDAKPASPRRRLLHGLVWLLLGLALLIALRCTGEPETAWFGLIPAGIGAAYLIYYFTVGYKEAELAEQTLRAKLAETNRARPV
jgi:uncharacterized membrane protein HdeD (DUF308 family)